MRPEQPKECERQRRGGPPDLLAGAPLRTIEAVRQTHPLTQNNMIMTHLYTIMTQFRIILILDRPAQKP